MNGNAPAYRFSGARWLRHPKLEPVNTSEAFSWCERSASHEVMSFNCWKGRPEELTAHAYAVEKLKEMKPSPLFRRRFFVNGEVTRATAYFCGLGYGKLYLDGRVCGER